MTEGGSASSRPVTLVPAIAVVVGNMVGTGVFTSLGYQLLDIQSGFVLMVLWVLGGGCALCGAVCYGELAAAFPRSGGEYHLLSRIYHPSLGFLAGWISVTVGFAAPIALGAMAFGTYFSGAMALGGETWPRILSVVVVLAVAGIHLRPIELAARFQSVFTALKVIFILVLLLACFLLGERQDVSFLPRQGDLNLLFSPEFAIALVFVMYAYTGWNAATYIVDEVQEPERTVPRALLVGTGIVTLLYLLLNGAFLYSAPMESMAGEMDVAKVAAGHVLGETGGRVMAGLISFGLVSALSAMIWVGPRVAQRMGEDFRGLGVLARKSRSGIPANAIFLQTAVVLVLILTSSFEQVLVYIELLLVLFALVTVAGVFWLRGRQPGLSRPVKAWGYPFTPALFVAVNAWMVVYIIRDKPGETLWGLATLAVGLVVYFLAQRGGGGESGTTSR